MKCAWILAVSLIGGDFVAAQVVVPPPGVITVQLPERVPVPGGITDFGSLNFLDRVDVLPKGVILTQPSESIQMAVYGFYTDGSAKILSSDPNTTFVSSNPAIVNISPTGLVTGVAPGITRVTISNHSVQGAEIQIPALYMPGVALSSITISTPSINIPTLFGQAQLTVLGTYSNSAKADITFNSSTQYSSSNPSVATITQLGRLTGVGNGLSIVTVSNGALNQSIPVTVGTGLSLSSISIAGVPVIRSSSPVQLTVIGLLSDGSSANLAQGITGTTYATSASSVATVTSDGIVVPAANGDATVTATNGRVMSTALVHVNFSSLVGISITPSQATIPLNSAESISQQQLVVTGRYSDGSFADLTSSATFTTYESTNSAVASVGPSGLVVLSQPGQVTIQVTNAGVSSQAHFTVTNFNPIFLGLYPGAGFTNVAANGQTVYLTAGTAGLRIIDTSNAAAPRLVGSASTPGNMVDVSVSGKRVFVAETSGLAVFDVSSPANPSHLTTISGSNVLGVTVSGGLVYFVDGGILKIYDANTLTLVGQLTGLPGAGQSISVSGTLAFIAADSAGLNIVDVSIPLAPKLLSTVPLNATASNVAAQGRTACVPQGSQVACVDATNPAAAAVVGQTNLPGFGPRGLAFAGNLLLVADFGFIGQLPVFNVSNPASPNYLAIVPLSTKRGGYRLAVSGSFVYEIDNSGPVPGLYIALYAPQVPATPPTVSLQTPIAGAKVVEGAYVPVSALAADSVAVSGVTYSVNGVAQSSSTTGPFYNASVRIPVGTAGSAVQISAQAQNVSGLVSSLSSVSVSVVPDPLTTVQGRLTDVFGNPVAGAQISLVDGLQTTSGSDGSFVVTHVPTAAGIETVSSTATVSGYTLYANVHAPPVLAGITDFGTIILNGNITLSNSVSGTLVPLLSPYVVTGAATIDSGQTLTIPAGTIVKFAPGASLTVNGALIANGTASSPVTFTSLADNSIGGATGGDNLTIGGAGQWVGVVFSNADLATNLTYTTMRYAQAMKVAGGVATFNNATFTAMSVAPIQLTPGSMVAGQGNTATGNPINGIDLLAGGTGVSMTWNNIGLPFVIRGGDVNTSGYSTLTIQPGVIVKLKGNVTQTAQLGIFGQGIKALGTPSQPVIFTSLLDDSVGGDTNGDGSATTPAPGDWLAINVGAPQASVLSNVIMRYGGSPLASAMLNSGSPTVLANATLSDAADRAIYSTAELDISNSAVVRSGGQHAAMVLEAGSTVTVVNTLFDSNKGDAVVIQGNAQASFSSATWSNNAGTALFANNNDGTLSISTASFVNNSAGLRVNPALASWNVTGAVTFANSGVAGMDLIANGVGGYPRTWPALSIPYVIRGGNVYYRSNLTIKAGAIIKLLGGSSMLSGQEGAITALGTPAAPIVFTSLKDDSFGGDTNGDGSATSPAPGDWFELALGGNTPNTLDNVIIRYGGSSPGNPMVNSAGVSSITNFDISYSANYGLQAQNTLTLATGTVTNNLVGAQLFGSVSHSVTNVQFNNNRSDGLQQAGPSRMTLQASQFSNNAGYGLKTFNDNSGAGTPVSIAVGFSSFTGNGAGAVRLDPNVGSFNVIGPLTATGNAINGIDVIPTGAGGQVRTWANAGIPYVVRGGNVNFRSNITLSAGVIVKLGPNAAFMGQEGAITASGTAAQPVIFTSLKDDTVGGDTNNDGTATSPAPGDWFEVALNGNSPNSLDNVIFRYGGSAQGNPMVNSAGVTTITNFDLESSANYGLQAQNTLTLSTGTIANNLGVGAQVFGSVSDSITNVQFNSNGSDGLQQSGNSHLTLQQVQFSSNAVFGFKVFNDNSGAGTPVSVSIASAAFLSNRGGAMRMDPGLGTLSVSGPITASGNAVNSIDLIPGQASSISRTWPNTGIPFTVRGGNVAIRSPLTLSPGVIVKLGSGASFLGQEGTITALGAAGQPIVFTSLKDDSYGGDTNNDGAATTPAAGDWSALGLGGNGSQNNWSHVIVRYGGGNGSYMLTGGNLTASNCDISYSAADGFQLGSNTSVNITSSTFRNNVVGYRSVYPNPGSTIRYSIFSGNSSFGVTTSGGSADVAYNYWGSASGPNVSSNPGGSGDAVPASNVTYQPFLTAPPAGAGP